MFTSVPHTEWADSNIPKHLATSRATLLTVPPQLFSAQPWVCEASCLNKGSRALFSDFWDSPMPFPLLQYPTPQIPAASTPLNSALCPCRLERGYRCLCRSHCAADWKATQRRSWWALALTSRPSSLSRLCRRPKTPTLRAAHSRRWVHHGLKTKSLILTIFEIALKSIILFHPLT